MDNVKISTIVFAFFLLLSGCGREVTPDGTVNSPQTTGSITISGPVAVAGQTASGPSVTVDSAGTVEVGGERRNVYIIKCEGIDGSIAIVGIGSTQCTHGEVKAVGALQQQWN